MHKILQPEGWPRPKGYANGIAARGTMVFTAGIVGWNAQEQFVATDLTGQLEQALKNAVAILAEAGAKPEHIVRMTWYITDKEAYTSNLAAVGDAWRRILGKVFPAIACVQVVALVEDQALIEIEVTAVIPDSGDKQ